MLKWHAKLHPNQQKSSMPLMAIMTITQDGGSTSTENVTCYSCGELGHYAGKKSARSQDALPHLLLIGIAAAMRKERAKVDLGMAKAKAKAKTKATPRAKAKARERATVEPMAPP